MGRCSSSATVTQGARKPGSIHSQQVGHQALEARRRRPTIVLMPCVRGISTVTATAHPSSCCTTW